MAPFVSRNIVTHHSYDLPYCYTPFIQFAILWHQFRPHFKNCDTSPERCHNAVVLNTNLFGLRYPPLYIYSHKQHEKTLLHINSRYYWVSRNSVSVFQIDSSSYTIIKATLAYFLPSNSLAYKRFVMKFRRDISICWTMAALVVVLLQHVLNQPRVGNVVKNTKQKLFSTHKRAISDILHASFFIFRMQNLNELELSYFCVSLVSWICLFHRHFMQERETTFS